VFHLSLRAGQPISALSGKLDAGSKREKVFGITLKNAREEGISLGIARSSVFG